MMDNYYEIYLIDDEGHLIMISRFSLSEEEKARAHKNNWLERNRKYSAFLYKVSRVLIL